MCTQTEAQQVKPQEEPIDVRCVVKFRPHDDWEGEYGFDWFREGDYGECFIDLNDTVDRNFNRTFPIEENGIRYSVQLKANSDYKSDGLNGLVGKYGGVITYGTRNGTTTGFKTEIRRKKSWFSSNYQFTDYDGELIILDPHTCGFSAVLVSSQKDASGKDINADLFAETNYSCVDIIDSNNSNQNSGNIQFVGKYFVPYISLFYVDDSNSFPEDWKGCKAKVKLKIKATGIKELKFVYDGGIIVHLVDRITQAECSDKLTKIEINSQTEENINIEISRDFFNHSLAEGDGYIKVYALHNDNITETFAGKLCVVKSIPKRVKILFIPIQITTNNAVSISNRDILEDKKRLKKYFSHAHIIPDIKIPVLDLKTEKALIKIVDSFNTPEKDSRGIPIKNVIEASDDLLVKLEDIINNVTPEYRNTYKMFILNVEGRSANGSSLNGRALDIPSKTAVVFKHDRRRNPSTICHELLHCVGLNHSFHNLNTFTFERYKTSNIMDYRFDDVGFIRLSSWKWQWDEIRNQISKEVTTTKEGFVEKMLPKIVLSAIKKMF